MKHAKGDAALSWLHEGLAILAEAGPDRLTIDALCLRLGRTKGAFYHHFSGRGNYIDALMGFWQREMTHKLIEVSRSETDPGARIQRLTQQVLDVETSRLEVAIRGWAAHDPAVGAAVLEVDANRQAFLLELLEGIAAGEPRNQDLARLIYAVYMGARYLSPPVGREEMRRIYDQLARLIWSNT